MVKLTEDQRDCLQELMNVAMGQAGDSLARYLEVFVHLSVPRIRLVQAIGLPQELEALVGAQTSISAVRQGFTSNAGAAIRGEAVVIFSATSFHDLAELMDYEPGQLNKETEQELLLDITNILNAACLNGFANQLGHELSYSPPSIIGDNMTPGSIFIQEQLGWQHALLIEINYRLDSESFKCNLLMLMPDESIQVIQDSVDQFLESM